MLFDRICSPGTSGRYGCPMYAQNHKVKLAFAKTRIVHLGHAVVVGLIEGDIEVENLAYRKRVVVHYTTDEVSWKDVGAVYDKSLPRNKEVWKFSITLGEKPYNKGNFDSFNCSFAIRYKVDRQSYWDNNEGKDYHVSTIGQHPQYDTITLGKPVYLFSVHGQKIQLPYHAVVSYFSGKIMTKEHVSPKYKQMEIIYTTDNWRTAKRFPAKFSDFKGYWEFSSPSLPASIDQAAFIIVYKIDGKTYWDDNHGEKYVVSMR